MSSTALTTLTGKLANRFGMEDAGGELMSTLKATAFKGNVSDAQMLALLIVAHQYGLNPWTKEIYAFPDKNNGIVPVVGVDGWARIINGHEKFDGMDFTQTADSCTCSIYRKDRGRPVTITEYLDECERPTAPWKSHPRRMLRHKAMIQCSRIAFGYSGIYDHDEAERIVEKDMGAADVVEGPRKASRSMATKTATLEDALEAIEAAEDKATLFVAQQVCKRLKDEGDVAAARKAYAEKVAALKARTIDAEAREAENEPEAEADSGEMTEAEKQAAIQRDIEEAQRGD